MFKPIHDMMIIEAIKEFEGIVMPDNKKPDTGNTFRVLDVGPGFYTDTGMLIEPSVDIGDRIALVGKVLKIPDAGNDLLVARASDVILVDRAEKVGEVFEEQEEIENPGFESGCVKG